MSIDTVSAMGGSGYLPPDRTSSLPSVAAPSSAGPHTPADPAAADPPAKPEQPFLLVPTIPLSPTVLAELVGRQLSLNGPTAGA
ncbi:hypothetical protein [Rhodopila sp.]|uniref:hypothetical protein n=1 Tax=Rhodopila sp. TaxID=2480087 RepID=UPI003D0D01E0